MTTPTGSISFGQIANEFGYSNGSSVQLGNYRVSPNIGSLGSIPLDSGVPKSGTIKASDLRGKRLNIVIDYFTDAEDIIQGNIRRRYNNAGNVSGVPASKVIIVGGFKSKPSSTSGTRVIANVDQRTAGGINPTQGQNYCSFRTGGWDDDTQLELVIGLSGAIYGAGGDGGAGSQGNGNQGGQGTSALGIEYPTTITNQGIIVSGRGGGGGGGGGQSKKSQNVQACKGDATQTVGGGGGGGGLGYPGGNGGSKGADGFSYDGGKAAGNGTGGNTSQRGQGGNKGFADASQDKCGAYNGNSGGGGQGGDLSNGAGQGGGGNVGKGGQAGNDGHAIVYSASYSWTNKGNVQGDEVNGTVQGGT